MQMRPKSATAKLFIFELQRSKRFQIYLSPSRELAEPFLDYGATLVAEKNYPRFLGCQPRVSIPICLGQLVYTIAGKVAITSSYRPKEAMRSSAKGLGYYAELLITNHLFVSGAADRLSTSENPDYPRFVQLWKVGLPINAHVVAKGWMAGLARGVKRNVDRCMGRAVPELEPPAQEFFPLPINGSTKIFPPAGSYGLEPSAPI